jgi:hypothetical protein
MCIINVNGVEIITEGYIPLDGSQVRDTVKKIVLADQIYVANRRRIRTERNRKNISLTKRLATAFCSL